MRDGREIWLDGDRAKDVTTHPAFRNTVRMIARFYDALHDPARKAVITTETDTGSGGRRTQEEVTFVNHALVNPSIDRDKPLDEEKDIYVHVVKETDASLNRQRRCSVSAILAEGRF